MERRQGFAVFPALGLIVVCLVAMSAGVQYLGPYLAGPAASPARADLIVSLGGDRGARIERALALYDAGFAPRLLVTGARLLEHDFRVARLQRVGVPPERILVDGTAASSWEEAQLIRRLMAGNDWQRVLVVSDPPHLRRLDWALRQAFHGTPVDYRLIASHPAWWDADRWWEYERARRFVASELVKLTWYQLRYRW